MESRSRICSISGLLKILLIFIMNCSMCKLKTSFLSLIIWFSTSVFEIWHVLTHCMIFGAIILLTWLFQTRLRVANFEPPFSQFFKKWRKNVIAFSRRFVAPPPPTHTHFPISLSLSFSISLSPSNSVGLLI